MGEADITCGDAKCDPTETISCKDDCPNISCGDGECHEYELGQCDTDCGPMAQCVDFDPENDIYRWDTVEVRGGDNVLDDVCVDKQQLRQYECIPRENGSFYAHQINQVKCSRGCFLGACVKNDAHASAFVKTIKSAEQEMNVETGQKNVHVFTFSIESRWGKTLFSESRIQMVQGWEDIASFSLLYDSNNDGKGDLLLSNGKPDGSKKVIFDFATSPHEISIGKTHTFSVRADIDPTTPDDIFQIGFAAGAGFIILKDPETGEVYQSKWNSSCKDGEDCRLYLSDEFGPTVHVTPVPGGEGSVKVHFFPPSKVNVGENDVRLLLMRIQPDEKEDQTFYSITIYNNGTAQDGDLQNMSIYREGKSLAFTKEVASFNNQKATFEFDIPFTVMAGDLIMFELRGDIKSGGGRTFIPHFKSNDGVIAAGSIYGYEKDNSIIPSSIVYDNASSPIPIAGSYNNDSSSSRSSSSSSARSSSSSSSTSSSSSSSSSSSRPLIRPDYIQGYELDVVSPNSQVSWFNDTDILTPEGKSANALARFGILNGYTDGGFKGYKLINRAEISKVIAYSIYDSIPYIQNNGRFPDVVPGEWYEKFVMFAESLGILKGDGNGLCRPGDGVNTAEFVMMLQRAFNLQLNLPHQYTDVPDNAWFASVAGLAPTYNLLPNRTTNFDPSALMTRDEVSVALNNLLIALNVIDPAKLLRSIDLGFKVNMPGSIRRMTTLGANQTADHSTAYYAQIDLYMSSEDYSLSVGTLPEGIVFTGTKEELEKMMNNSIASIPEGELISFSHKKKGKFPALRYTFSAIEEGERGEYRGMIVVAERHMYTLISTPELSDAMFSSFLVLPGITPPGLR